MRIAVSFAGRGCPRDTLHLHEFIDLWRATGDEVFLVRSNKVEADLPEGVRFIPSGAEGSPWNRALSLVWGQARHAQEAGAEVLFIPEPRAPLVAPMPVVALLTGREPRPTSISERIRLAAGRAGLRGASALLRFDDLPPPSPSPHRLRLMPPFVASSFEAGAKATDGAQMGPLGLTQGYCLSFADSLREARLLLAAWSWVTGAVGDEYLLAIVGGGDLSAAAVNALSVIDGVSDSVRYVDEVRYDRLAALFRGAAALLHAGPTSTGQELRWALACGVPVAGVETADAAMIVADAGYLVTALDARALGAACLTAIVDADVAGRLRDRGLARARAYHEASAREAWSDVLHSVSAGIRDA